MSSAEYFVKSGNPATSSQLASSAVRAEFALIETGFGKLPDLSGNNNKAVVINAGGTGLGVTAAALALAVAFTTAGSGGITLTSTGSTNVTLPTTGTLATLAGVEELDNKTLDSSVGKGTWTASGTWTLPALTLGGTVSGGGQQLNNIIVGTVTPLAGTFTTLTANTSILPGSDGAVDLGSTTAAFNNLHLDTGATINVENGNAVITHSSGIFTVSTGDWRITTAGTNDASAVTVGGSQTLTNKTLTSPVLGGTVTGTYSLGGTPTINVAVAVGGTWTAAATWTLPAFTLGGTVTSNGQSFSGTIANLGTVTTADINGGTLDGVTIGGASAAAATVTTLTVNTNANPDANDGAGLGTTALGWSDLHLATGALINVANGNAVITHSSGIFTVSTGDLRVTTAGTNTASVVTVGGTQTLTSKTLTSPTIGTSPTAAGATWTDLGTVTTADINGGTLDGVTIGGASAAAATVTTLTVNTNANPDANDGAGLGTGALGWSDLFLASGALLNFANGNAVVTHSSGVLTVSTGDLRVTTAGTNAASVVTVGGTQTLTSKTLTSPTIGTSPTAAGATWTDLGTVTTADINGGTLDGVTIGGATPAAGTFTTLTATGLTTGRIPLITTGGLLTSNAGLTYSTPGPVLTVSDANADNCGYVVSCSTVNKWGYFALADSSETFYIAHKEGVSELTVGTALGGAQMFSVTNSGTMTIPSAIVPDANDGAVLGSATLQWSDLFLAEGAVINWDNGDATLTQTGNVLALESAAFMIGDTANANNTAGLTINQGAATNHIITCKGSDIDTGLTTIVRGTVEVDDFCAIGKGNGANGALLLQGFAETTVAFGLIIEAYCGAPATTDVAGSFGAIHIAAAQHDGANALVDMAANSNLLTVAEIDSGGTNLTRMLLKADDGELHLGNTTLVALDDEDDALLVRAMQMESASSGIRLTEYDNPFDSHSWLMSKGLAGEKDKHGFFLFPLQSRLHAHEGAIWQGYVRQRRIEERLAKMEARLLS